tara:strand:+ start:148 stop:603 length:456 start_codon:yes stop_codon:yes gene_type:complete
MIEEKIKQLLKERKWTFADFQNMQGIIDEFQLKLQDSMTIGEQLEFIFNKSIYAQPMEISEQIINNEKVSINPPLILNIFPDEWDFQDIFSRTVSEHLDVTIANVLKEELMNANINFNKEVENNEVSKNSLVGKSSKRSKTVSKKSDALKK